VSESAVCYSLNPVSIGCGGFSCPVSGEPTLIELLLSLEFSLKSALLRSLLWLRLEKSAK